MKQFYIFNETKEDLEGIIQDLEKVMDHALKKEKLQDVEFNIIFVDLEKIQEINRVYRGIDRVTDVITFALEDGEEIKFQHRLLGDIYISYDKAREQAIEYGHSLEREISFLAVHGFYHLLGYDHMMPEEEKVMFQKQEEVLQEVGITR